MKQNTTLSIIAGAFLVFCVLSGHSQAVETSTHKSNVIVILADDQGTVDLGCYGSTDLHTPHLDALAARGVRFTQFYAGARSAHRRGPVCCPAVIRFGRG